MNTVTDLVNISTNYLERVLDKGTIKNITGFGDFYKQYITIVSIDSAYGTDLSDKFRMLVSLVLNEDLPALYIGESIYKLAMEKNSAARSDVEIANLKNKTSFQINENSFSTLCKTYYSDNSTVSKILTKVKEDYDVLTTLLNRIPPKDICIYQQYNICCYTEEYISKYLIEGKLSYGDIANINNEVANIYNFVFQPNQPKTEADKLGEYYLRINDATPELFLDLNNNLFVISSVMNYAYDSVIYNLFRDLTASNLLPTLPEEENMTLDDKKEWWNNLSKKYRLFFELLRENTLSY